MQGAKAGQSGNLSAGYFKPDAIRKTAGEILVLDTCIAGFWIHCPQGTPETKAILEKLKPGTEVKLYRDPDNIHDKWAIAVYIEGKGLKAPKKDPKYYEWNPGKSDGAPHINVEPDSKNEIEIGFLPRYKNQTVARLMDLGRQFNAYIAEPVEYPEDSDEFRRNYSPTEHSDQPPLEIYMVE